MTNPLGYMTAFVVEYTAFWYVHCNIACMISLAFGSFLLAIALINTIKRNICEINKDVQFKANRLQASKKLISFIEFHSTLKQLSNFWIFVCFAEDDLLFISKCCRTVREFSDIYQPIIMSLFLWCLICICGTLLLLQYGLVELQ